MTSSIPPNYILCAGCKCRAFRRGAGQKFCEACSNKAHVDRHTLAAEAESKGAARRDRVEVRQVLRAAAAERAEPASIAWDAGASIDLEWMVRVAVPFSYRMSKNAIWASVGVGHVVLRKEARAQRDNITAMFRSAIGDRVIATNRLWIDLMVEKPNHRGDALNVIDLVADALKDATGLDDRWYSIRRMDWRVRKNDPMIYIGIGQSDTRECGLCSYCGRILPLDDFTKSKSQKNGRARVCRECTRLEDTSRRPRGSRRKVCALGADPRVEVSVERATLPVATGGGL